MPKIEMGKKYRTRDGRPVRVLAVDRQGAFPVVALVQTGSVETALVFSSDGKAPGNPEYALIEVKPEIKGWVNLYKNAGMPFAAGRIFATTQLADDEYRSKRSTWERLACIYVDTYEGDGLSPEDPCK